MSDHKEIIETAKEVIALAGVAGVCERKLAQAVLKMAAQIAELQKLCDAVLRYDDSGGRQPWRELADMAKALAPVT